MKKKILISSLVIIMVLSMTLVLFTGCGFKEAKLKDFTAPDAAIGANGNELSDDMVEGGIKPVTPNMSAYQMLQVGMENFYNAKYSVIEYNGGVKMTLAGAIKVNQVVQSTKIRDGLGDAEGNNARGATYFADNKSHSQFAKIYEKFIITPDSFARRAASKGDISYSSPNKKSRLGKWTVKKYGEAKNYDTLNTLVTENCNNPTILWMYDLQESFITDQRAPKYDAEQKTYNFSFKFDPLQSTKDYLEVMKVQLATNAGMGIEGLTFLQLVLEVSMWENGMIRSINVNEAYKMKMAVTPQFKINSAVNLKATQLFSYDPNEADYKIADHISAF